jgi:hypothetical protein
LRTSVQLLLRTHRARFVPALAAAVLLAGCESESSPTGPDDGGSEPAINEIVTSAALNASSTDTLIHFSFATGNLVNKTADWDIALRRYEVRLNGGVAGTKGVVGYALGNNDEATDAQVLAFTLDNTRSAFDNVREAQIPADASFQSDRLIEDETGYLNLAGVPSANGTAYWKLRTANGGFALVRVTAISMSPQFALQSVTVESRVQTGATLGAAQTLVVPVAGSAVSVSVAANQLTSAPNGCNWDLRINPQTFGITVNSACNAGTYPGATSPTFAAATTANDAPQYGAFLAGLTGPIPNSITVDEAPFRYNLEGTNRLHPTFNTYLVKSGTRVYKLQVVNYYNAAGASGWPTLRYARIK